jgi:hypothetical protein
MTPNRRLDRIAFQYLKADTGDRPQGVDSGPIAGGTEVHDFDG